MMLGCDTRPNRRHEIYELFTEFYEKLYEIYEILREVYEIL